ncbi:MAG TPA: MMPL family transporter, partial [Solirubrobacteraceae bacterium]|nr:MMPL family transporter [Solirubrobacteraceae bacterium]
MRPERKNLASRLGHWSATHRKSAILGWLALVLVATFVGGAVGTQNLDDQDRGSGESGRAQKVVADAFPKDAHEQVLVQSRSDDLTASAPAFRAAVRDVVTRVSAQKHVAEVRSPLERGNGGQISEDGRSALVSFAVRGSQDQTEKRITAIEAAVQQAARDHPQLRVEQFGAASASKALSKAFEDDFQQAEVTSLPLTLIILVFAFGALVAAGIPLLLGFSSVLIAVGLISLPSQLLPVDEAVSSVILL